jgi:hypothetical protein
MQCPEGIGRVGRSTADHLDVGHVEPIVVLHGQPAEVQPGRGAGIARRLLVRRRRDRDQQDAVQAELVERLLRGQEVGEVRRVERPAEDADAAGAARLVVSGRARPPGRRT